MNRTIKLIATATLLIFSFFAGVKYSDSVKSHASWLFENKEEEVELPDLSKETNTGEIGATVDENGENLNTNTPKENQIAAPMDDINEAPATAPTTIKK